MARHGISQPFGSVADVPEGASCGCTNPLPRLAPSTIELHAETVSGLSTFSVRSRVLSSDAQSVDTAQRGDGLRDLRSVLVPRAGQIDIAG